MAILQTIRARASSVGGLPIRRVLPSPERQMVGPFIFMDQGGPIRVPRSRAQGVPEHPHAGLSTFTYLIEGQMHHRDSAGHAASVGPGDIALMTSGSGITHEELPDPNDRSESHSVYFVQMWLALPDAVEEMAPTFELHRGSQLPVVEARRARARVAMGSGWGTTAPTTCHATTLFAELQLEAGGTLPLDVQVDEVAVMVLEGDARLGDETLAPHALHVLDAQSAELRSAGGCRAIVIGGGHFPSERFIGGSFVASSPAKLRRWMREAARGNWPRIQR